MRYAMICNNGVIEILNNQETIPEWPPTPEGYPVIAVECDETVELGMVYNPETGEFSEYVPEPVKPIIPEPTQLDNIEESQLVIMEAIAEQYEESEARYIDQLEVQATIYETILELGGNM